MPWRGPRRGPRRRRPRRGAGAVFFFLKRWCGVEGVFEFFSAPRAPIECEKQLRGGRNAKCSLLLRDARAEVSSTRALALALTIGWCNGARRKRRQSRTKSQVAGEAVGFFFFNFDGNRLKRHRQRRKTLSQGTVLSLFHKHSPTQQPMQMQHCARWSRGRGLFVG